MGESNVAQINVRLPRKLKESGDTGLQALGLSPSDAVRALWTRLSARGADLAATQSFLTGNDEAKASPAQPFGQSGIAQGWSMVDEGIAKLGLTCTAELPATVPDSELAAMALEERMQERGLM